jgi:hypothetical protein
LSPHLKQIVQVNANNKAIEKNDWVCAEQNTVNRKEQRAHKIDDSQA